jgi:hypothetical protein
MPGSIGSMLSEIAHPVVRLAGVYESGTRVTVWVRCSGGIEPGPYSVRRRILRYDRWQRVW